MTYNPSGGGGGGGAVSSVFGRTGTVAAASNDYTFAQLASTPTTLAGYAISDAAGISHTHIQADVSGLVTALAGKAPTSHTHAESDITGLVTDLSAKVGIGDSRLSDARTPTAHAASHASGGTDALTVTEAQVTNLVTDLAGKAATVHTHAESDVTNLVTDLAGKAPTVHTHAAADVASGVLATARVPHVGIRTTANVALSASTTINLTGLDLTVANGDVWILDYVLPVTVSAGTVGLKPIFTLPASSTGTMDVSGTTSAVTAYSYTHSTTPGTAAAVAFMTALFTGYVYVRAVLTMGAAGTCRIGVTTGTSAAGNLLAGCSVMAFKL